jgi:hypothetical protein
MKAKVQISGAETAAPDPKTPTKHALDGEFIKVHKGVAITTSTAMLEKHYGHTSNVASAAELTKGGTFKGGKKAKAVDWL